MRTRSVMIAAGIAAAGLASAAQAGTKTFFGTRSNVDSPGAPAARCGSRTTAVIQPGPNSTSVGMSNLGGFTPLLSHCIQLPLSLPVNPFDLGEFIFDFGGGDTLFGSYAGTVTGAGMGVFDIAQTHVVNGGTGRFLNASGGFGSAGTLTFPGGRPTVQQSFEGTLAVPEPASWALMILGFGLAGAGLRTRSVTARFA